jgi:hypothetical protein
MWLQLELVGIVAATARQAPDVARRDRPVNDDGALHRYLLAEEKSVLASFLGHPWPLDGHASYEPTPEEIAENEFGKSDRG